MTEITTADLFITQAQLALNDPRGPHTAGSAREVVDWVATHTVAATGVPARDNHPQHYLLEFDDDSAVVVIINEEDEAARIANLGHLALHEDWRPAAPPWTAVGEQPKSQLFLKALWQIMAKVPHPSDTIRTPRLQPCAHWADTMLLASRKLSGSAAQTVAREQWTTMQQHAEQLRQTGDAHQDNERSLPRLPAAGIDQPSPFTSQPTDRTATRTNHWT